jgi:hypothetical protein
VSPVSPASPASPVATVPTARLVDELTRVNSELVTRLRELARVRALTGVHVRPEDDEAAAALAAHLDRLRATVRQVEAEAALPRQGSVRPGRLVVVPPAVVGHESG